MSETAVANGLRVPSTEAHKFHRLRAKDRDPDYREACVRDYVKEHRGEVMKLSDFALAAYGSTTPGAATALIKKLMRKGRLTRTKVKNGERGLSYTYLWHNERPTGAGAKNGPVTTVKLDLQDVDFATETLKKLDEALMEFADHDNHNSAGRNCAGAMVFRNWLNRRHDEQVETRETQMAERLGL